MTIEIQEPELEQRIQQIMNSGAYANVEDLLAELLSDPSLDPPKTTAEEDNESAGHFLENSPLWRSGLEVPPRTDEPRVPEL